MPHRDFNPARRAVERVTFAVGPHTFECRLRVRPEVVMAYEQLPATAPAAEVLEVCDGLVTSLLLPEHVEAWKALRATDDEDALLELSELADLAAWLVESVVNRPLAQPSSSSAGSPTPTTGTPSMAVSPSPAGVASTA